MPVITVRDIPEDVYRDIKKDAKTENRSMNGQCLHIFQEYMKHKKPADVVLKEIKEIRDRIGAINFKPEEVKAMIEEGRP